MWSRDLSSGVGGPNVEPGLQSRRIRDFVPAVPLLAVLRVPQKVGRNFRTQYQRRESETQCVPAARQLRRFGGLRKLAEPVVDDVPVLRTDLDDLRILAG